jgi:uncharacterized membrane protein YesL
MRLLGDPLGEPGPGIDKHAPPKRGLALFAAIVGREWWELIKLNLLVALFCLPVVTIPAAVAAAARITITMIRDENCYLWRDFSEAFRAEGVRASLVGWPLIAAHAVAVLAIVSYGRAAGDNPAFAILTVVSVFGLILLMLIAAHLATMLVSVGLPLASMARNAVLLSVLTFSRGIVAVGACLAIWLLHVAAYPVSIFIPATFGFSGSVLIMTFYAFSSVRTYVLDSSGGDNDDF